jgi:hypothetical protein
MTPEDLAAFTPVALQLSPAVGLDWGELGAVRFAEPFFDQTVERWAGGPSPRLVRTGLDALAALEDMASLDPTLLIFHMSRCGSTLVSRLLSLLPDLLVLAEPGPINSLLLALPALSDAWEPAGLLRLLVRALGRPRLGEKRHFVLKLSSWNVLEWPLFRRAFPGVPMIFLQRRPDEVLASIAADPPGWLALRERPPLAARLFGVDASALPRLTATDFAARALAAMLAAATELRDTLLVDYVELPEAVWSRIIPFAGLSAGEDEIRRLREEARYDAKSNGRRIFSRAPKRDAPLEDALIRRCLAQRYGALDARRRQALTETPRSG